MAVTFGLDISHHQGAFDLARAAREGVAFVILKATEGSGFVDSRFSANLAAARQAGLLAAAYHYVRSNASAADQVANVARVVPRDVPVIPDVEANSGGVPLIRDFVARLRAAGYKVPLTYVPRWYWQQIGSPSLAGLPPLWSSRYPDNVIGSLADEYADVPAHYWNGYGGLPVALLQFTSSAVVAGRSPIDGNAFRGTRAQLAALLGGQEVEDDVSWDDLVIDPSTGQPAKDSFGNRYTRGTEAYFTNRYSNELTVKMSAMQAAVAAIANDQDVTPEQLAEAVDRAVAEHTPTAEQVAAAQRPFLAELVREVVPAEQAELIIQKLAEKLGAPVAGGN